MKPVTFDPQADSELVLAAAWYEERREGLGEAFLFEIKKAMNGILQNPRRFPRVPVPSMNAVVRRAPVSRFPYSLVYADLVDQIRVLAVAHAKRNPEYWVRRNQ